MSVDRSGSDGQRVLVSRHAENRFHLPDPDNPDEPRCDGRTNQAKSWKSRTRSRLPDSYDLCRYCDPDEQVSPSDPDWSHARALRDADPDGVAGGGA